MWCNLCQSDVATAFDAEQRRVTCATCGQVLSTPSGAASPAPATDPVARPNRTVEARQLLDRWASSHLFDPYGPPRGPLDAPVAPADPSSDSGTRSTRPASSATTGRPPGSGSVGAVSAAAGPLNSPLEPTAEQSAERARERTSADRSPVHAPLSPDSPPPGPPHGETSRLPADAIPGIDFQARQEELDRLTSEILARVSKISEARRQQTAAPAPVARDRAPAEAARLDVSAPAASASAALRGAPAADSPVASRGEPSTVHAARDPESDSSRESAVNAAASGTTGRSGQRWRLDRPETGDPASRSTSTDGVNVDSSDESSGRFRLDPAHAAAVAPHIPVTAPAAAAPPVQAATGSQWFSGIGQGLSYLGILGLTAGTSLVIVSYFGGPTAYAPTGWLVSTIGQMLLFLGIVTLVSSGMEQTSSEVQQTVDERMRELSRKLDLLDDRLLRIDAGHGPGPGRPHLLDHAETDGVDEPVTHRSTRSRL